jgi:hypothetical protein
METYIFPQVMESPLGEKNGGWAVTAVIRGTGRRVNVFEADTRQECETWLTKTFSKHTPGPWQIHGTWPDDVVDATGSLVVSAYGDYESPVTQANARLIAAAPELLAALEHMVAVANWSTTIQSEEQFDAMIASAEAAIRKAKGESL